jgi:hypothetical protein
MRAPYQRRLIHDQPYPLALQQRQVSRQLGRTDLHWGWRRVGLGRGRQVVVQYCPQSEGT